MVVVVVVLRSCGLAIGDIGCNECVHRRKECLLFRFGSFGCSDTIVSCLMVIV